MMDTKIEIGQENISFEMESKQEDNAETYKSLSRQPRFYVFDLVLLKNILTKQTLVTIVSL